MGRSYRDILNDQLLCKAQQGYSPRLAKAILAGKTRTKPKQFQDPQSGRFYRLITTRDKQHQYEELPLEEETIYTLEIDPTTWKQYANSYREAWPEGYTVRTFRYNTSEKEFAAFPPISGRQLHHVLMALTRADRWNITECLYDKKGGPMLVNIVFHGDEAVGAYGWNTKGLKQADKTVTGNFFAIHPEHRGRKIGRELFHFTNHQMVAMGAHNQPAGTSDNCKTYKQSRAKEFYESIGYKTTNSYRFTYEAFCDYTNQSASVCVPEAYFTDVNGEEMMRYSAEYLKTKNAQVARELLRGEPQTKATSRR